MEHISLHLNTSTLNTNLSSPAIMTSGADGLFGALNPIICPLQHTHIPTAVERGDVNQNWSGVVFDDDGDGQVGRSQSA